MTQHRGRQLQQPRNTSSHTGRETAEEICTDENLCYRAPLANTPVGGRDAKLEKRGFGLGDRKAVNEHEGKHRRA